MAWVRLSLISVNPNRLASRLSARPIMGRCSCRELRADFILIGVLLLGACTDTPFTPRRVSPGERPSFLITADDPCYGGSGWCHIWGDASMDNGYVTYSSGSGGYDCPSGCLTYPLTNTMTNQVLDALQNHWNWNDTHCVAIHDYVAGALSDRRIRYYDMHLYDSQGQIFGGDAHWNQNVFYDSGAAIHLDSSQFGSGYSLSYILAHEGAHIVDNIPESDDATAQYWGNRCGL
jgi:hypothetical protein